MGMEFRPYYLAKEWQEMGNKVRIVAASFSHLRGEQPKIKKSYEKEKIDGIDYFWIKVPSYNKNNILRFVNISSFVIKLLLLWNKIVLDFKPDIIIGSSTYPFDMFAVNFIAKRCCARTVFEIHDLWPLSPVELGGMSPYHPFIVLTKYAEKYALKSADRVISVLPFVKDYCVMKGIDAEKIFYVPNGLKIEEWDTKVNVPNPYKDVIEKLKVKKHFVIGYLGSHSISDSLETFILAAKKIKNENCSFVLIGSGPEKNNLIKLRDELELENVHFLPYIQKPFVPVILELMDVLYIGWKKRDIYKYGISPTKLFDYMMAGKPIICGISAGNDIVKEARCGLTVEPEDCSKLAQAILTLMNMSEMERCRMGKNGKLYVQKYHNYGKLAADFLGFVNKPDK